MNEANALAGIVSFTVAGGLITYLTWFIRKSKSAGILGFAFFVSFLSFPQSGWACSVCFGNPTSILTKSANTGILVLLFIVTTLLAGFAGLFISWARRARKLRST